MTPNVVRVKAVSIALVAALATALCGLAWPAGASAATVPVMSVRGNTVSWTAVSGVTSYVFVRKVPGQADQYSVVNGTSQTPAVVPGRTVNFGVRTNVSGSTWAKEVSIAYATTTTPPPTTTVPPSSPSPPVSATRFRMGTTSGSVPSYQLQFMRTIGTREARIIYPIGTSAASMASDIDAYARAGIRVLPCASFPNRLPTTAEAQNVATWAKAYGPGGTFWQGKTYPANTTVDRIEFGHETSYSYQFADNSLGTYATRAQTYALRFKDAQVAAKAANPNVGLLAIGDNAVNQDAWVKNMFKAVPDLGSRAAGWTIHPYGPTWRTRIDSTINSTKAAGSPDLPIWVTEWGLSTDNGRCLDDNYGYGKCLTYAQAASTLHSVLTGMLSTYGSRMGAFFVYQTNDQAKTGTKTGREYYFGALQQLGAAKGAYTTEIRADLALYK